MTRDIFGKFERPVLTRLFEAFFRRGVTLYLVGGAVRNALLSLPFTDIDVAAGIKPERAAEIAEEAGFFVTPSSLRLGTLIFVKDGERIEFTSFRKDSYPAGKGSHEPSAVEFVADLETDAKRRDFKANAIYYDYVNRKIVDPLGGAEDVEKKILSATREARLVFSEDALRLMRLARFSAQLDFTPQEETFEAAREFAGSICDVSKERVLSELSLILHADTKYEISSPFAHYIGLKMLNDLMLTQRILPELFEGKGMKQNPLYHKFDVFTHIMETFRYSAAEVRFAALMHDIAKPACMRRDGNVHAHAEEGAAMTQKIMRRLLFPVKTIANTVWLVKWHMLDLECAMRETKLKWFAAQNAEKIKSLVLLKHADASGSLGTSTLSSSGLRLEGVLNGLIEEGAPLCVKELKVNGRDATEREIPAAKRGETLLEIWKEAVINPAMRTREAQLKMMERHLWKSQL